MNSRSLAIKILDRVINEKAYSNIALSNELNNCELDEKDKALTTELVYGTLRRLKTLDMIISSFVRDIKEMDKKTLNILRVGIYQMRFLDKVPSYAACNESVELAKEVSEKDSKLVNGILRNYVKKEDNLDIKFRNKIDELSFEFSFEPWLIRMFIKQYGEQKTRKILYEMNEVPKVTVRVNDLKTDYDEVFEEMESNGYKLEEGYVCPEAIIIDGGKNIENNQTFIDGKITVQDESAMLVAPLLNAEENMIVFDLCSAPGGKTTHIAELMNNTGVVKAFDIHENKLNLVKENCERLGITNVEVAEMDATKMDVKLINSADRILADVPCSGLGIIRKKPEIKWTKKRNDLKEIVEIQRQIMENAYQYLKSGGEMIYSTCTLNKEENEENVSWFINKHKDLEIEKIFVGKGDNFIYDELNTLTILPNKYMDGFYIAKIIKK